MEFIRSAASRVDDEVDGEVIKGAIDYILLPLVILAVSGPIFVVMYIVMGSVEFRLPPNFQAGRNFGDRVAGTVAKVFEAFSVFE